MDDITIMQPVRAKAKISPEERARRQAAVDFGRGNVRLEGFVISPAIEDLNRRYIDGEMSSADLTAAIMAHYHL